MPASTSMPILVSHADAGTQSMPSSERRSSRSDVVGALVVVDAQPGERGPGQQRRALRRSGGRRRPGRRRRSPLAEAEDPQRDPRVVGRDRDVDRGAVADLLAASGGGIGVEHGREEDRAALRRRSRAPRARPARGGSRAPWPTSPTSAPPPSSTVMSSASIASRGAPRAASAPADAPADAALRRERRLASSRAASRWSVQSPPRSTVVGTPGSGMMRAELAAAALELEGGDVVLDAVVVRRRASWCAARLTAPLGPISPPQASRGPAVRRRIRGAAIRAPASRRIARSPVRPARRMGRAVAVRLRDAPGGSRHCDTRAP